MRGRSRLIAVGVVLVPGVSFAQPPTGPAGLPGSGPFNPPAQQPALPGAPRPLPPGIRAEPGFGGAADSPTEGAGFPKPDSTVLTPQREKFVPIDLMTLAIRPQNDEPLSWRLYAGQTLLHDFKSNQPDADAARRALREIRPTVWGTIGNTSTPETSTVVGYGVTGASAVRPTYAVPAVPQSVAFDLKTLRVDQVRGAWCMRDAANLILSFGTKARPDAEQAVAVCKKYGFNRLGQIGTAPTVPFNFFYAAPTGAFAAAAGPNPIVQVAQEEGLSRTGVLVPGSGYVGERLVLDPRNLEVRKDRADYVLVHAADVLAKFGPNEWSARDALRAVKDGHFTEFCRVGGLTFFLVNGQPPTRVPFSAQGTRFVPSSLRVRSQDARWAVFEPSGQTICTAASQEEAEQAVRVIQAFKFDQLCVVGQPPRAVLRFLAKTGGH